MRRPLSCAWPAAGFSLLENVVALAIVTIGLLGTSRLFAEALRALRDNQHRQAAIVLGEELIAQLIAQRDAAVAGERHCRAAIEACFDDPFAQAQWRTWRAALSQALPQPQASLAISGATPPQLIRVQIDWLDSRGAPAAARLERLVPP